MGLLFSFMFLSQTQGPLSRDPAGTVKIAFISRSCHCEERSNLVANLRDIAWCVSITTRLPHSFLARNDKIFNYLLPYFFTILLP